jgi:hypothetical protein
MATAGKSGWRRLSEPRWFAGVDGLIDDLRDGHGAQQTILLREAMHLMIAAPAPLATWLGAVVDVEAMETMLAAGAAESAALALIPLHAGYMLSRGPNGVNLASVFLPGPGEEEYSAEADTAALALLAAFVSGVRDAAKHLLTEAERLN